jgi:hypothetical protein
MTPEAKLIANIAEKIGAALIQGTDPVKTAALGPLVAAQAAHLELTARMQNDPIFQRTVAVAASGIFSGIKQYEAEREAAMLQPGSKISTADGREVEVTEGGAKFVSAITGVALDVEMDRSYIIFIDSRCATPKALEKFASMFTAIQVAMVPLVIPPGRSVRDVVMAQREKRKQDGKVM